MARAHGHALGHGLDREVALGVVEHPLLEVADGVALGELGGELGRELGLAAGAAQEEHEPAGDAERDSAAEVLLDDGQGEVHARRHAGRGPQVAVARVDGLGVDVDGGVATCELAAHGPVRGHAAAVEQARLGQQEGAGAHRGHTARVGRPLAQPVDQAWVGAMGPGAVAAGDDQRVDGPDVGQREVAGQAQAAARGHRVAVQRGDADVVAAAGDPGGGVEDLQRAGDVQRLDPGEGDDDDGARGHGGHGAACAGCLQGRISH